MSEKIQGMIAKARAAQEKIADFDQEQVDAMVKVVAHKVWDNREELARVAYEKTGKGTYEWKLAKKTNTISSVYQYLKGRKSVGLISVDEEKQLWTYAKPVGVLGCICPVTNPAATPIGNGLPALKTRNAMIVSPHPGAQEATEFTCNMMREALEENGYPADLIQCIPGNTLDDSEELMQSVDLILATGGPGMVKAAYSAGKPALGVGQGNVQCIVDEDFDDIDGMVEQIAASRLVDFGMPCTGEQTIHCPKDKVDEIIAAYQKRSGYYIDDEEQIQKIRENLFIDGMINRDCVGQTAYKVAQICGVEIPEDTTILLLKVDKCGTDEILAKEILCPMTRIFAYDTFEEGVAHATANNKMEGSGHSSCIWSENDEHIQYAASKITAGRVMVNQPATCGSGRQFNGLGQTVSLGCGYWGGNSVGHNVNYKDMINYTVVSKIIPGKKVLTPEEIMAD